MVGFPASYVSLLESIIKDIKVLILLSMAIKVSFLLRYGNCVSLQECNVTMATGNHVNLKMYLLLIKR